MTKTVLDLFTAEQAKKHNKIEITIELNTYINNKTGNPSVNELLNFYLKNQKNKPALTQVTSDGTLTMSVAEYESPYGRRSDKIEIAYHQPVKDKNTNKSFKIEFESDKAGNFLITKFDYKAITAIEIKELINLLFYGKQNPN